MNTNRFTFRVRGSDRITGSCKEVCEYLTHILNLHLDTLLKEQGMRYPSIKTIGQLMAQHRKFFRLRDEDTALILKRIR